MNDLDSAFSGVDSRACATIDSGAIIKKITDSPTALGHLDYENFYAKKCAKNVKNAQFCVILGQVKRGRVGHFCAQKNIPKCQKNVSF